MFHQGYGVASAEIQLDNVSIQFADEIILKNISVEVPKGEAFVLIGPSGQGKSVLLKLMAGILKPTEGQVFIRDADFNNCENKIREQLRRKMGMLFQKNALFDSLTAIENICFPMEEITTKSIPEIIEIAEMHLESVGLSHARNLYPDEMSGGMQKRLGIARALALDPEIIFYDDPTAGLDPITSRKIVELIIELKTKHNSTIVVITNDMNRAFQLGTKIGLVTDKSLLISGTPEQTKNSKDPRIHQFIKGLLVGPMTEAQ
jgi:phospholipid/cholesterol/gamma-HCH transport system ATP-binding protein